jgi:hypothetical protein
MADFVRADLRDSRFEQAAPECGDLRATAANNWRW